MKTQHCDILIGEVLVLPPDFVKLEDSLLVSRLHPEQL